MNVTGVGNGGDGGGNCVSVNTGSHCTAGTVRTYTDRLWLTRYIDSTASVAAAVACGSRTRPASQPTPNWSTFVERSSRMSALACAVVPATDATALMLAARAVVAPVAASAVAGSVYVRTGAVVGAHRTS